MFYKTEVKDHIRVPPNLFDLPTEQAILKMIKEKSKNNLNQHENNTITTMITQLDTLIRKESNNA